MRSRIEKLRDLFLLTFFLLVIFIIFTPLLVRNGFSVFSEEILESILLLVQVSVAWKIFRLYEGTVKHREKSIQKLEGEYQRRERELLEAFAYLGKINVKVSLIESFLKKLKAPSSRKEAESYIGEILQIALSLSRKNWVTLRAIDTSSNQTISEFWAKRDPNVDVNGIKIGNKDIVKWGKDKKTCEEKGYCVFGSAGSELSLIKVYLIFFNGKKMERDVEDFLGAAVNQCEVILTLFELQKEK